MASYVIGVGMTKFTLAGKRKTDWPDLGHEAAAAALSDAGVDYAKVQAAVAGYCELRTYLICTMAACDVNPFAQAMANRPVASVWCTPWVSLESLSST